MYIKPLNEFSHDDCLKIISSNSKSFIPTTATPKPYKSVKTPNQDSILSKTQALLQERRKRSKSQPPDKRSKLNFEFLSTNNYLVKHSEKNEKKVKDQNMENNDLYSEFTYPRAFLLTLV
jgi:hypothetical protein